MCDTESISRINNVILEISDLKNLILWPSTIIISLLQPPHEVKKLVPADIRKIQLSYKWSNAYMSYVFFTPRPVGPEGVLSSPSCAAVSAELTNYYWYCILKIWNSVKNYCIRIFSLFSRQGWIWSMSILDLKDLVDPQLYFYAHA